MTSTQTPTQLNQLDRALRGGPVTKFLREGIFVTDISEAHRDPVADAVCNLPYLYDHVGGHGTNSPRRGVCVVGDRLLEEGANPVSTTAWTACQNASNVTLLSATAPLPEALREFVPECVGLTRAQFPDVPITSASYALGVANEYLADAKHTICAHSDAQSWYSNPPVFASLTFWPDGAPHHPDAGYRFQVLDEDPSHDKPRWVDVDLWDRSVCVMRADIYHRVLPPLQKFKPELRRRRINVTLRNLCSPATDPLGWRLALANHCRHYSIPQTLIFPSDVDQSKHHDLVERYKSLAARCGTTLEIVTDARTAAERRELHRRAKQRLTALYEQHNMDSANLKQMISKSNVVYETTLQALTHFPATTD